MPFVTCRCLTDAGRPTPEGPRKLGGVDPGMSHARTCGPGPLGISPRRAGATAGLSGQRLSRSVAAQGPGRAPRRDYGGGRGRAHPGPAFQVDPGSRSGREASPRVQARWAAWAENQAPRTQGSLIPPGFQPLFGPRRAPRPHPGRVPAAARLGCFLPGVRSPVPEEPRGAGLGALGSASRRVRVATATGPAPSTLFRITSPEARGRALGLRGGMNAGCRPTAPRAVCPPPPGPTSPRRHRGADSRAGASLALRDLMVAPLRLGVGGPGWGTALEAPPNAGIAGLPELQKKA